MKHVNKIKIDTGQLTPHFCKHRAAHENAREDEIQI